MYDLSAKRRGKTGNWQSELFDALGDAGHEALERLALERDVAPAAAFYLAREGDVRGGDLLVGELLKSENVEKQEAALMFLSELRDPRCVSYLAEQLQRTMWLCATLGPSRHAGSGGRPDCRLERDHRFTHRGAVRGLGLAKDPRAIPHLIRCLGDEDGKTRGEAANALVNIGEASIAPLQAKLAEDTPEARQLRNRIRHTLKRLGSVHE